MHKSFQRVESRREVHFYHFTCFLNMACLDDIVAFELVFNQKKPFRTWHWGHHVCKEK
jgi:hypothetical protein